MKQRPLNFYVFAFILKWAPLKYWWYPLTQILGADYCSDAINVILYEFDIMHAVSLRCIGTKLSSLFFHYCTVKCILVPAQVIYVLKLDVIFSKM